jgi:hypothetical protein
MMKDRMIASKYYNTEEIKSWKNTPFVSENAMTFIKSIKDGIAKVKKQTDDFIKEHT